MRHTRRVSNRTFPLALGRRGRRGAGAEVLVELIVKVLNRVIVVWVIKRYCNMILAELSINHYTAHNVFEAEG
jgi:hypothetical protein